MIGTVAALAVFFVRAWPVAVLVTAVIGCLRPALRAARVDPMNALREG